MEGDISNCAMAGNRMIVAGFGYRQHTNLESLLRLLKTLQSQVPYITALSAPVEKIALLRVLGEQLNVPVVSIEMNLLPLIRTQTQSLYSYKAWGTGSVAEAVALAAAGANSKILISRVISNDRMATCAIAEGFNL